MRLQEKSFLSVKEVARLLSVHPYTIHRLIHRGEIGSIRVGRAVRIPLDALESFVDVHRTFVGEACSSTPAVAMVRLVREEEPDAS